MNELHQLAKEFYSIKEFAYILDVHPNTIRRAIKSGRISALRIGNQFRPIYRIARSEISRMAEFDLELILERILESRKEK